MGNELTSDDLDRIEHLLKKRMATLMGAIQEDRSAGPAGSVNLGSAKKYIETARTLRRVLQLSGGQAYVPLRMMHGADEWLDDEVKEVSGVERSDTLGEVVEKVHRVRNPNFDPFTITDHDSVPGRS